VQETLTHILHLMTFLMPTAALLILTSANFVRAQLAEQEKE
jgi:hypothetical protein